MILVTGAAGFIGFHLANKLLETGYDVIGYDNVNDYYDPKLKEARLAVLNDYKNFTFFRNDLSDEQTLAKLFDDHSPQLVVHLAAQAGVRYSLINPKPIWRVIQSGSSIFWKRAGTTMWSISSTPAALLFMV